MFSTRASCLEKGVNNIFDPIEMAKIGKGKDPGHTYD